MSINQNKYYGDCDYCANHGSCCDECEHAAHEFYDFWEEAPPEEITKIEKAKIEKANEEAIQEYIELDIPNELKQAFDIAKKCTCALYKYRGTLQGVLMTQDGYMVSSDNTLLCKIQCDCIPEKLKGRVVITLQDGQAGISVGAYPKYKSLINISDHTAKPLGQITRINNRKNGFTQALLQLDNTTVALDDTKLQLAEEILQGEIMLYYKHGEKHSPIIFKGANAVMAVSPLRLGTL